MVLGHKDSFMITTSKSPVIRTLSSEDVSYPNIPWKNISPVLLDKWLCLYPSHERHLKEVQYSSGKVSAKVEPHNIEYSTITVDYYTASQVLLLASQLSYVLAGASMKDKQLDRLPVEFYTTFIKNMVSARIYYTDFHLRFKGKISNAIPQRMTNELTRVKNIGGLLFIVSILDFANGLARAKMSLAMPLNSKG